MLKVFNDANITLSSIYYPITNLFDDCMSQEPDLIPCIEVMKIKWLDYYYYQNIPNIYLIGIIFYPSCKLDYLFDCLDIYYKCLVIHLMFLF